MKTHIIVCESYKRAVEKRKMKKEIKFNVNNNIKVKLTTLGFQRLADEHNELIGRVPKWEFRNALYYTDQVDKDGYSEFQMWEFMRIFGPIVKIGGPLPFYTDILITIDEK